MFETTFFLTDDLAQLRERVGKLGGVADPKGDNSTHNNEASAVHDDDDDGSEESFRMELGSCEAYRAIIALTKKLIVFD